MYKRQLLTLILLLGFSCFAQDTEAPTAPLDAFPIFYNNNAGTSTLIWTHATDNVAVTEYDVYVDDVYNQTVAYNGSFSQGDATITGIFGASYCFKVLAKDAAGNTSPFSNTVCFTRFPGPLPNDLYISAIMNGTGGNTLISITNTIGPTNLDSYSMKISRDGNATWQETYTFPSGLVIPDISSHIIANSQANPCESGSYDEINDMITDFDGNDTIGLFKNDVLIDILGTLGDGTTYASNTTLVRKPSIDSPNTTYTASEWDTSASNTCTDLGMHTQTLSVTTFDSETFSVYPNPTSGDIVYINTKNNVTITSARVYDMTGKQVLQQANPSNEINVQGLQKGIYILQLEIGNQTINKKLIKQ